MYLKEGDPAPVFTGIDQDGQPFDFGNLRGRRVVLYFYPKDMTPGCTAEACNLRDNYQLLKGKGFEIVGVSADDSKRHRKFADKYELPFVLVADTDKRICNAYKVWGEKKFMGRTFDGIHRVTYVIDEDGKIERIFTKVRTRDHGKQILETY